MLGAVSSFFKKKEDCATYYKMGRILGQGSFATVRLCTCKADGSKWAIKIIKRNSLAKDDENAILTEIKILQRVDHPNIVKLKEVYDSKTQMYIVMEVMYGGELFDRIVQKEFYSEMEAKKAFRQILAAVAYCHDMDVVHRDLKPENLLYATESDDSLLKLADFGLAHLLKPNEMMHSSCGTPAYVAPEILRSGRGGNGYGKEVDIWSIGVILYILLCGFPPFYDEDHIRLFAQIQKGMFDFPSPYWDNVSDLAKDLIRKLLATEPGARLTAKQTAEHPWLGLDDEGSNKPLPFFTENMKAYNARRRLRHAIRAVQILHRLHVNVNHDHDPLSATNSPTAAASAATEKSAGRAVDSRVKLEPAIEEMDGEGRELDHDPDDDLVPDPDDDDTPQIQEPIFADALSSLPATAEGATAAQEVV